MITFLRRKSLSLAFFFLTFVFGFFLTTPAFADTFTPTALYVTNQFDGTVFVIDPATGNKITTIPASDIPQSIFSNGTYLYVAQAAYGTNGGAVTVIDPNINSVIKIIPLDTGGESWFVFSPDRKTLYISDKQSRIYIIDTATNTLINTLTGFTVPNGMAIDPLGKYLYVVNGVDWSSNSFVSVLDINNNYAIIATITVGIGSNTIALTPDGRKAYVPNYRDNTVSVIDTITNQIIKTIDSLPNPVYVVVNPAGTYLYVVDSGNPGEVTVVNTVSDLIVATIPVGNGPVDIAISPDNSTAYVTNFWDNTLSVIDTNTNTLIKTFNTGGGPFGVAVLGTMAPALTPTPTNTPPVVGPITAPTAPVTVGIQVDVSASFTDANVSDTHTAVWDWGDGMTSPGDIVENNGSGTVTGDHVYLAAGVYEVTLTVTDNSNASDVEVYQYISVYNPTPQGLFNGVRKFTTPAGSYTESPNLSGQVMFGITSKYQGTDPTGDVSMSFNAAGFEFEATAITVLIVANGNEATLRGTGEVNGTPGYTFFVTGLDGGQGGDDFVRFQIKDAANNVVFDSQPGAADTADPTALITAGNVVIH